MIIRSGSENRLNIKMSDTTEKKIRKILKKRGWLSSKQIAEKTSIKRRTVIYNIKKLLDTKQVIKAIQPKDLRIKLYYWVGW